MSGPNPATPTGRAKVRSRPAPVQWSRDSPRVECAPMLRAAVLLMLVSAGSVSAQGYTVIAVSHTDNKVSEVHPVTGEILQEFVVPGEWYGETHEGRDQPGP